MVRLPVTKLLRPYFLGKGPLHLGVILDGYIWCGSTPMGVLCKGIKLNKAIVLVGIYKSKDSLIKVR